MQNYLPLAGPAKQPINVIPRRRKQPLVTKKVVTPPPAIVQPQAPAQPQPAPGLPGGQDPAVIGGQITQEQNQAKGLQVAQLPPPQTTPTEPSLGGGQGNNPDFFSSADALMQKYGIKPFTDEDNPIKSFSDSYGQLYKSLGLSDIKSRFDEMSQEYSGLQNELNDKIMQVNENPWLTEGMRQDKVRALQENYQGKLSNALNKAQLYQSLHESGHREAQFVASTALQQQQYRQSANRQQAFQLMGMAQSESHFQQEQAFRQQQLSQEALFKSMELAQKQVQSEAQLKNQVFNDYVKRIQLGVDLTNTTGDGSWLQSAINVDVPFSDNPPAAAGKTVSQLTNDELGGVMAAMAKQEGYGADPSNRPTRNNNPLAITLSSQGLAASKALFPGINIVGQDGGVPEKGFPPLLQFATPADGWKAAQMLLRTKTYGGLSVNRALHLWSDDGKGGGYGSEILQGGHQNSVPTLAMANSSSYSPEVDSGIAISQLISQKERNDVMDAVKETNNRLAKFQVSKAQAVEQLHDRFPKLKRSAIAAQLIDADPRSNPKVASVLSGFDRIDNEVRQAQLDFENIYQKYPELVDNPSLGFLIGLHAGTGYGINILGNFMGIPPLQAKDYPEVKAYYDGLGSLHSDLAQTIGQVNPTLSTSGLRALPFLSGIQKSDIPTLAEPLKVVMGKWVRLQKKIAAARIAVATNPAAFAQTGEVASAE